MQTTPSEPSHNPKSWPPWLIGSIPLGGRGQRNQKARAGFVGAGLLAFVSRRVALPQRVKCYWTNGTTRRDLRSYRPLAGGWIRGTNIKQPSVSQTGGNMSEHFPTPITSALLTDTSFGFTERAWCNAAWEPAFFIKKMLHFSVNCYIFYSQQHTTL